MGAHTDSTQSVRCIVRTTPCDHRRDMRYAFCFFYFSVVMHCIARRPLCSSMGCTIHHDGAHASTCVETASFVLPPFGPLCCQYGETFGGTPRRLQGETFILWRSTAANHIMSKRWCKTVLFAQVALGYSERSRARRIPKSKHEPLGVIGLICMEVWLLLCFRT